jgi:hypothetical protein
MKGVLLAFVVNGAEDKIPHAELCDQHFGWPWQGSTAPKQKNQPAGNNHKPAINQSDPPSSARPACRDVLFSVLVQQRQGKNNYIRRSASVAAAQSTAAPQRRLPVYSQHHRIHAGSPRCQFLVLHEMASQVLYLALYCVVSARCVRWHGCQEIQSKYLRHPFPLPFCQCLLLMLLFSRGVCY